MTQSLSDGTSVPIGKVSRKKASIEGKQQKNVDLTKRHWKFSWNRVFWTDETKTEILAMQTSSGLGTGRRTPLLKRTQYL